MKIKIALAALLLTTASAYAADSVYSQPVSANFDWSGAYIGASLGGGFGKAKHPFSVSTPDPSGPNGTGSLDITSGGFLGGVQAGYNWQSGQVIYGVEADFQGSNIDGSDTLSYHDGGFGVDGKIGTKVQWFGTVRGRIGYAATERFMPYVTGGFAYGHYKSSASFTYDPGVQNGGPTISGGVSKSGTSTGWTVGAGAEYAVTDHVTFKGEYLYTDLGKSTLYSGDLGGLVDNVTLKNDLAFHTFRVGLNYKF